MGSGGSTRIRIQDVVHTLIRSIVDVGEMSHKAKANDLSITSPPGIIGHFPIVTWLSASIDSL